MNILQVSAPKSGSFWLNTILKSTLKIKNLPISYYIRDTSFYENLKYQELSFKDQAGTDMIDIEDNGVYFRISSLVKQPIQDLSTYSKKSTLAWTHSTYCRKTPVVFSLFDRKVCIVRDPRDTALSAAKFAFTPYMQKHYPTSYPSVEAYLAGEYDRLLRQWIWFYGYYLLKKEELDLHFVFYENLLDDFFPEYDSLLKYLGLDLTSEERKKIAETVSFSSMKQDSPAHLQKGKSRKWVEKFSAEEVEKAADIAGGLMQIFGYPLAPDDDIPSPAVPPEIPKEPLSEILSGIDWKSLY